MSDPHFALGPTPFGLLPVPTGIGLPRKCKCRSPQTLFPSRTAITPVLGEIPRERSRHPISANETNRNRLTPLRGTYRPRTWQWLRDILRSCPG